MKQPPVSFWLIAIAALLWAITSLYLGSYELESKEINLSAEEFAKTESLPSWYKIIF